MTSDPEHPEPPQGLAEDAMAFEDWEDGFIARNRDGLAALLEEAYESIGRGEVHDWHAEDVKARGRLRYREHLAKQRPTSEG